MLICVTTAAPVAADEYDSEETESSSNDYSHGIEVETILTRSLIYRFRTGDNNFLVGVGVSSKPDKLEGLLSYQTFELDIPIEGIVYRRSRLRGEVTTEDFGLIRVTAVEYYAGIGVWFKPKVFENFYIPVSFGIDFPIFKQSRFESPVVDDFSSNGSQDISLYLRLGGGHEF